MTKHILALPIPPLSLGVNWTGKMLVRYMLDELDRTGDKAGKQFLSTLHEKLGPDAFWERFNQKAKELNERFAARSASGESAPQDAGAGLIPLPTEVN